MARTKKKSGAGRPRSSALDDHNQEESEEQGLASDEAGRLKIKRSYEELLGIRVEKLKGRVLNREKINKSIDGVYFICFSCKKVSHNLDEGLVEDPQNQANYCASCAKEKGIKAAAS
ncbi:MAG TPA: hypothetical protein VGL11_22900 [Candidatus Binatia bacterium]|jgi:hypothetical protein